MQSPVLNNNYYFIGAKANERFENYLHQKIKNKAGANSQIHWWSTNSPNLDLHCTLAQGFSNKNLQNPQPNTLSLQSSVLKVMQSVPSSFHFKVDSAKVNSSEKGWVILTLKPKKKLQKVHEEFTKHFQNEHIKPAQFSNQAFCAYVSIGQLKENADQLKAQQQLDALIQDLKKDLLPFVMYDVVMKTAGNQLAKRQFSRKDVGIVQITQLTNNDKLKKLDIKKCSVKPSENYKGQYSILVSEKKFINKIQKKYPYLFIKP